MGQFVGAMAYSLRKWDIEYGTQTDLGWDYYSSMAFGGLYYQDANDNLVETDSFKELVPNQSDRDSIRNILINEQNGNSKAKGKKCD